MRKTPTAGSVVALWHFLLRVAGPYSRGHDMQAGTLTDRISIERKQTGQDEIGQPIEVWVKLYDAWAEIKHLSGLETIKSDAPTSTVKASIRIRRRPGINAGMRVTFGPTIYDINAVLPNARRKYVDLVCTTTGAVS